MKVLLTNIKELLQVREQPPAFLRGKEMGELPTLKNAWLLIENEFISDYGSMDNCPLDHDYDTIDCTNKLVLPAWCDSHTHLVYAGNREQEFTDRINGLTYQEIAERGGGILNSAKKVQNATEDELYNESATRLEEIMSLGTGTVEIKSGYGLTTASELKMLRVAKRLAVDYNIDIKTTFLGAHAIPSEFREDPKKYVDLICEEMLPQVAEENLADFVDVFCERGYFSVADTNQILTEAKRYNLQPKIHVNQFNAIGGIAEAVKHNARSVDHLEVMTPEDFEALRNTDTIAVALPSCSFFLNIPYTPGRELIELDIPLALATDFNPGSTPSGNMNFVVSAACIKMKLTPAEAINAATLNGAYAMNLEASHGSITRGKKACLIITKDIPSYAYLPYAFGSNHIHTVIINGKEVL